jgi:antitoxin ParD1/3/4
LITENGLPNTLEVSKMEISLPDSMQEFVETQIEIGGYSSASEYFRELVRAEQKRQAKQQLEQVLLSALGSGDPAEVTPELLEEASKRMRSGTRQR